MGVSPFGYLRIEAYLQLPAAFRSLSRPSSAPDAKAFPLCSSSLELLESVLKTSVFVTASLLFSCLSFANNCLKLFTLIYFSPFVLIVVVLPTFLGKTFDFTGLYITCFLVQSFLNYLFVSFLYLLIRFSMII